MRNLREYLEDGGMRLNLHPGQVKAWNSKARFVAIISGTQGGKTSFAPNWLMREMRLCGSGDYLYVSPTLALMDKKALPEVLEVFEKKGKLGRYFATKNKFVCSEDGMRFLHGEGNFDPDRPTQIFFGYATNPESLESMTAKAAVLDEAGQNTFKLASWEAILRRVALNSGRILIGTTPYNFGWLYHQVYKRWQDGDPDYEVVNFPSVMNPSFPKEEAERAKRTMATWKYNMFYLGKFTKPAGLIYDIFDEYHLTDPFHIAPNLKRVIGLDFGGTNTAASKFALLNNGKFVQYEEYWPKKTLTLFEHLSDILKPEPSVVIDEDRKFIYYDRNLITIIAGASSETQWRAELAGFGVYSVPSIIRDVELGIERVYSQLKTNCFQVFRNCTNTIDDFYTYSRETDDAGEVIPGTIQDKAAYHLLDTARYGISWIGNPHRAGVDVDSTVKAFLRNEEDPFSVVLDENLDLDNKSIQRIILGLKENKQLHPRERRLLEMSEEEEVFY